MSLTLPSDVPRRNAHFLQRVGRRMLRMINWRIEGTFPDLPRFVAIVAPHTSNWDFIVGVVAAFALDLNAHWIGKHTLFRWPFEGLMRWLGGIPVDRKTSVGLVDQVITEINRHDQFILAITPEGTRGAVDRWKSGFYHVARGAGLPIVCISFDYPTRRITIGPQIEPTGDYEQDLKTIQEFYRPFRGKRSRGT